MGMGGGMGGMGGMDDGMRGGGKGGGKGVEEDWVCPACGNSNYASRTECNMRKCRAPKPALCPPVGMSGGPSFGGSHMKRSMDFFDGPPDIKRFRNEPPEYGGPGGNQRMNMPPVREGDWVCIQCGNVNFATREVCNMRICGAPKPKPVEPQAGPGKRTGDWVCIKCGNVNFASRTVCNMRKCDATRPDIEEAAAAEAEPATETEAMPAAKAEEAPAAAEAVPAAK